MSIFQKLNRLNLPKGEYVVCAGSALEAYGIRKSRDIDLAVTKDIYQKLKNRGWQEITEPNGFKALKKGNFSAAINFNCGGYQTPTKRLIETARDINGILFMSLKEIVKFKQSRATKKDKRDLKLIQKYLQSQT